MHGAVACASPVNSTVYGMGREQYLSRIGIASTGTTDIRGSSRKACKRSHCEVAYSGNPVSLRTPQDA